MIGSREDRTKGKEVESESSLAVTRATGAQPAVLRSSIEPQDHTSRALHARLAAAHQRT
jgi:hypothetical protein